MNHVTRSDQHTRPPERDLAARILRADHQMELVAKHLEAIGLYGEARAVADGRLLLAGLCVLCAHRHAAGTECCTLCPPRSRTA